MAFGMDDGRVTILRAAFALLLTIGGVAAVGVGVGMAFGLPYVLIVGGVAGAAFGLLMDDGSDRDRKAAPGGDPAK